ncbi:MAG: asparagine synthase (glutamine-hydrolyzing) [Candidatus Methylomirabilia bacterium]
MCGICGFVFSDAARPAPPGVLERMTDALAHRGPDDRGTFSEPGCALGHRRLSIIDLSPAGRQPMENEDGSLQIVFNGEIYNYRDLRPGLEQAGHVFHSASDTEVLLHLYEQRGEACLGELRGMFAFAIWDRRLRRLFAARDRVGKKPFVYAHASGGDLAFSSELASLVESPGFFREVDETALHHYLTYQFVPTPRTIWGGAKKLPPAHFLVWEGGRVRTERYWDLHYVPKLRLGALAAYRERFLEIFRESVRLRLVSDVPLGAFLSGGVDSSAVVAMMSLEGAAPARTFSIGFTEGDYDELRYARMVAERYGTEHQELVVQPRALDILPELVRHYGEPFADSSAVPTWYVSQLTRRSVTVALSGDGGDEAFGGYQRYLADRLISGYLLLPRALREGVVRRAIEALPGPRRPRGFVGRLKRFVATADPERERQYVRYFCAFTNDDKAGLYSEAFADRMAGDDSVALVEELYRRADGESFLDRTLSVDMHSYLPDDILAKVDIAGMGNGLETRAPFLDHRLLEFAAACPPALKLRGTTGKYLLKEALKPYLPREILRRRKMGFGMPVAEWFRGELGELAGDLLLSPRALQRGYFRRDAVERLLTEHRRCSADHGARLWVLLFLELWFREFIDLSAGNTHESKLTFQNL